MWRSSLGGDYVVTPQMLAGQQPINFSGPTDTPPTAPEPVTSASSSTTTTTASYGGVAPITPLPASGTSASASSSTSGAHPLDHGAGPATGSPSGANIE